MNTDRRLRIVHVLAPAHVGGLESVVRALSSGHAALGHHVTVVPVIEDDAHPFVNTIAAQGIPVQPIRSSGSDYRRERRAFGNLLRQLRPDVVHSHGYRSDILDLPVAARAGIATVTTLHGFTGKNWKVRTYERLQIRTARGADAVVAVSRGVARILRDGGVTDARLHLIRNAYVPSGSALSREAARQAMGIPDASFRIGWIGRLSREKGPDVMLDALIALGDTQASLSFLGEGPDRADLERRAIESGVYDRVGFHGVVPDAARMLAAFDVLALSSRTEGTPMVILEAMAAETPIVAARVGGVPDVLSAEDAVLVDPENPRALAAAIRSISADPARATLRARSARTRLETDFGAGQWLARYETLYNSLTR